MNRNAAESRSWQPLSLPSNTPAAPAAAPAIAAASPPAARPAPEPGLLTKSESAEWLRVSLSIVDRLIRAGELPVVRFEQRIVRVRVADLHAFAERHLVEAGEAAESRET